MSNTTPNANGIQSDLTDAVRSTATLASLTISMWSGQRTDRKISEKVKQDADAVGDTGRYVKNLLAGCDNKLKAVRAAYAAARAEHYACTLPWDVSRSASDRSFGPRLLPNALFMEYLKRMGALRQVAEKARDEFIAEYPALVQQAQSNLNGLANPADYPSPNEVEASFKLSFDFAPIPAGQHFQGLDPNAIKRLSDVLEARQRDAINVAQSAMWERVRMSVEHLIDRLDDLDGRFKSSTVENVRELIGKLPGFNCMQDERITTVVADITDMLRGVEAKDIRDDANIRAQVVQDARRLVEKLDDWGVGKDGVTSTSP